MTGVCEQSVCELCSLSAIFTNNFVYSAVYILLLVLCENQKYSEKSQIIICLDSYSTQLFAIRTLFGFVSVL